MYAIKTYLILSYLILSYLILSYLILSYTKSCVFFHSFFNDCTSLEDKFKISFDKNTGNTALIRTDLFFMRESRFIFCICVDFYVATKAI